MAWSASFASSSLLEYVIPPFVLCRYFSLFLCLCPSHTLSLFLSLTLSSLCPSFLEPLPHPPASAPPAPFVPPSGLTLQHIPALIYYFKPSRRSAPAEVGCSLSSPSHHHPHSILVSSLHSCMFNSLDPDNTADHCVAPPAAGSHPHHPHCEHHPHCGRTHHLRSQPVARST